MSEFNDDAGFLAYMKKQEIESAKLPTPEPDLKSERDLRNHRAIKATPVENKKITRKDFDEAVKSIYANPALSRLAKTFMVKKLAGQIDDSLK